MRKGVLKRERFEFEQCEKEGAWRKKVFMLFFSSQQTWTKKRKTVGTGLEAMIRSFRTKRGKWTYMMEHGLDSIDIVLVEEQLVYQRRRPTFSTQPIIGTRENVWLIGLVLRLYFFWACLFWHGSGVVCLYECQWVMSELVSEEQHNWKKKRWESQPSNY